jgi:hypothetical protein
MVGRRAQRLLLFVAAMNLHALNLNDVADAQAALRARDAVLRPPVAEFVGGRDAVAADVHTDVRSRRRRTRTWA